MRFLLGLALAVIIGQAIMPASATAEVCVVGCADDAPDGRCGPDCADCLCCAHGAPSLLTPQILTGHPVRASERVRIGESSSARSRAPADVFHVPKTFPV